MEKNDKIVWNIERSFAALHWEFNDRISSRSWQIFCGTINRMKKIYINIFGNIGGMSTTHLYFYRQRNPWHICLDKPASLTNNGEGCWKRKRYGNICQIKLQGKEGNHILLRFFVEMNFLWRSFNLHLVMILYLTINFMQCYEFQAYDILRPTCLFNCLFVKQIEFTVSSQAWLLA